jgi:hypothetical protein
VHVLGAVEIPFVFGREVLNAFHTPAAGSGCDYSWKFLKFMSTILCDVADRASSDARIADDNGVHNQVWRLLSGLYPNGNRIERRHEQRYPYPRLISLWPMKADGATPDGEELTVVGKHISEGGLGFFHQQPISHRLAVASLESSDGRWLGFLLDIHRCRFTHHGWYESGGKFLRAVPSPLNR